MTKRNRRSVQGRTGTGLTGLCKSWLKSVLCEDKPRTTNEYHQHMQEAFEAITEMQSIWREWAYGSADSDECLRRVSQVDFYIASDIWDGGMINRKQAARMTQRYSQTLPYIAAMAEAIAICKSQKTPVEDRGQLLASRLAPGLFGQKPAIPRAGSIVPDNLARDGEYNFRWDNLPQYNWDKLE